MSDTGEITTNENPGEITSTKEGGPVDAVLDVNDTESVQTNPSESQKQEEDADSGSGSEEEEEEGADSESDDDDGDQVGDVDPTEAGKHVTGKQDAQSGIEGDDESTISNMSEQINALPDPKTVSIGMAELNDNLKSVATVSEMKVTENGDLEITYTPIMTGGKRKTKRRKNMKKNKSQKKKRKQSKKKGGKKAKKSNTRKCA